MVEKWVEKWDRKVGQKSGLEKWDRKVGQKSVVA